MVRGRRLAQNNTCSRLAVHLYPTWTRLQIICLSTPPTPACRGADVGNYSCAANREWGDAALWSFSQRRGWRRHRDLPLPLLYAAGCTVKLGQGGCLLCTAAAGGQQRAPAGVRLTEPTRCHAACRSATLSATALAQRASLHHQLHYADAALVVGGQHFDGWLSRTLWLYNATEDSWARVGNAPLYNRGHVCGLHAGQLFMALGQQGKGEWKGRAGLSLVWAAGLVTWTVMNLPSPLPTHAENGLSYETGPLSARQFWAPLPPELLGAAPAAKGSQGK